MYTSAIETDNLHKELRDNADVHTQYSVTAEN